MYTETKSRVVTRDDPLLFRLLVGDEPQIRRALDPNAGLPDRGYAFSATFTGARHQYEAEVVEFSLRWDEVGAVRPERQSLVC